MKLTLSWRKQNKLEQQVLSQFLPKMKNKMLMESIGLAYLSPLHFAPFLSARLETRLQ